MKNNLGEIFYEGRIINLSNCDIDELNNIFIKLKSHRVEIKEQIYEDLKQLREV